MKYSGHVHLIYTTAEVECDEQEFIVQVLEWHAVCFSTRAAFCPQMNGNYSNDQQHMSKNKFVS